MGTAEWLAFAGLIVSILIPASIAIRRLERIEANTELHARQIEGLFSEVAETKSLVIGHAGSCDTDRGRLDERVANHDRRLSSLEAS